MRRKATIGILIGVSALVWIGASLAAPGAPEGRSLKVGYIDLTRVLKEYPKRQALEEKLRKQRAALERDVQARMAEVSRLRNEIEQLAKGTPERLDLERKARKAFREWQKVSSESRRKMDTRMAQMLRELYKDVTAMVAKVGREGGYDLIIKDQTSERQAVDRRQLVFDISQRIVLYAKPEYDISDIIIDRLSAQYSKETAAQKALPAPAK